MERAIRGPRTALPSHWLLRNTRSRKNHAAQILYARQRLDRWRAYEASMEQSIYELYMEQVNPQDTREIMQAEDTLTALLKLVENRELRDAIDRAAGRVAYLREVAAFEAGYGFMPE